MGCTSDHDGLGRYADPLCVDCDLVSVDLIRVVLKPGGTLVLSVPVGPVDVVVWCVCASATSGLMRAQGCGAGRLWVVCV